MSTSSCAKTVLKKIIKIYRHQSNTNSDTDSALYDYIFVSRYKLLSASGLAFRVKKTKICSYGLVRRFLRSYLTYVIAGADFKFLYIDRWSDIKFKGKWFKWVYLYNKNKQKSTLCGFVVDRSQTHYYFIFNARTHDNPRNSRYLYKSKERQLFINAISRDILRSRNSYYEV